MMAVGNQLVNPTLSNGQTLNGESMSRIFTQRTVWIVPSSNIETKEKVWFYFMKPDLFADTVFMLQ